MVFSDQLLTLSNQAKELEASAEAVQQKNEAKIARRRAELRAAIEAYATKVGEERAASSADDDGLDDIDFAIYSIKQAEYTILDAIRDAMIARADADAIAAVK
jgi:hypothetical protein